MPESGRAKSCFKNSKGVLIVSIVISVLVALGETLYFLLAPCESQVDIIFMLDTSYSVNDLDRQKMTDFCESIITNDVVKKNGQSIIGQFSEKSEFILPDSNSYISDTEIITQNFDNFTALKMFTDTWGALEFVNNEMVNAKNHRENVKNVLFFLTDGESEVPNQYHYMEKDQEDNFDCRVDKIIDKQGRTKCPMTSQNLDLISETAQNISSKNVEIYAIGVAKANETELLTIACGDESKIKQVDGFDELDGLVGELVEQLCEIHWWLLIIPAGIMVLGVLTQIFLSQLEVRKLKNDAEKLASQPMMTKVR